LVPCPPIMREIRFRSSSGSITRDKSIQGGPEGYESRDWVK
jgi:hypothetical protein